MSGLSIFLWWWLKNRQAKTQCKIKYFAQRFGYVGKKLYLCTFCVQRYNKLCEYTNFLNKYLQG